MYRNDLCFSSWPESSASMAARCCSARSPLSASSMEITLVAKALSARTARYTASSGACRTNAVHAAASPSAETST